MMVAATARRRWLRWPRVTGRVHLCLYCRWRLNRRSLGQSLRCLRMLARKAAADNTTEFYHLEERKKKKMTEFFFKVTEFMFLASLLGLYLKFWKQVYFYEVHIAGLRQKACFCAALSVWHYKMYTSCTNRSWKKTSLNSLDSWSNWMSFQRYWHNRQHSMHISCNWKMTTF